MHTTEVMLQQLYTSEISREDYLQAQSLVENAVSLLCDNSDAADLLCALTSHSDFLYAHSVAVSLYSSLIGKAMEWSSPTTVIRLSLGGLLHDVGKKEISREILEKPRMELTPDEIALFESHPKRGAEILAQLQCIPTDILQIAHEHHENCVGTGYPMRLRKTKITPLARVVSVANDFCNWMIKNPNSPGLKPVEAIHRMLSLNPGYYDEAPLRALMQIFNIQGSVYGDLADDRD
jgi:putative nucleotidyltransferase with HDIG domain